MKAVRRIYDSGYNYKILFIIASNINEAKIAIILIFSMITISSLQQKERENFTIIKHIQKRAFKAFHIPFVSSL